MSALPARPIAAAVALTAILGAAAALTRYRHVQRALCAERAARRITDAAHHRDTEAVLVRLRAGLAAAAAERAVLADADTVLTRAFATHTPDDPHTEGGPTI